MSTPTPSTAEFTGSGGLCLPPGRGAAGASAVVESLRDLPQLTEVRVNLKNNDLGEEEAKKLRATFAALPVHEKDIEL
ncbi:Nlrc5 [Symbiodinium necroappetens]|uniref:Nlrc5 protein n=1 Tax=Symbiodinium necroappetens TaxID=1628268 RepID=A0A812U0X8_9DINO|nr:Nlrc5 [Symbiodinium necroappetens]